MGHILEYPYNKESLCIAFDNGWNIKQVTYEYNDELWFQLLGLASFFGNFFLAATICLNKEL